MFLKSLLISRPLPSLSSFRNGGQPYSMARLSHVSIELKKYETHRRHPDETKEQEQNKTTNPIVSDETCKPFRLLRSIPNKFRKIPHKETDVWPPISYRVNLFICHSLIRLRRSAIEFPLKLNDLMRKEKKDDRQSEKDACWNCKKEGILRHKLLVILRYTQYKPEIIEMKEKFCSGNVTIEFNKWERKVYPCARKNIINCSSNRR